MKTIVNLSIGFGLALAMPGVAFAQTAPAPAEALDPTRVAASRDLMDLVMPPAERDTMVDNMVRPMLANMQEAIFGQPALKEAIGTKPAVRAVFERYMTRTTERTIVALRAEMPSMLDAMARAYARRFSLQELADIKAFFQTPSGQSYLRQSATIMGDPDVLAWQRKLMERSMGNIQTETQQIVAELRAAMEKL